MIGMNGENFHQERTGQKSIEMVGGLKMGCDIHLYVEKRVKGNWVSADKWTPDKYDKELRVDYKDTFYSDRNYDLFAILANVRNGHGFAGCDTGDGFVPMCEPKGLPGDVSKEVKQESDGWDADGHSHSFFTVAELMAYDWTQRTNKRGVVNALQFFQWSRYRREYGEGPESWCGGVGGPNTRVINTKEMETLVSAVAKTAGDPGKAEKVLEETLSRTYTDIQWNIAYSASCKNFLSETLPRLWRLGKPEDVRIVFWFDN